MKPNERKLKMRSIAATFALFFILMALPCFAIAAVLPFGSAESLLFLCLAIGHVFLAFSASIAAH
jgi:hypothetical protein